MRPTTSPTSLSESVLRIAQRECHRSRPEPEVSDLWKLIADTGAASDLVVDLLAHASMKNAASCDK